MTSRAPGWTVVVPVKGGPDAKSRLATHVDAGARRTLADALALDTLDAVLATPSVACVVVVTGEGRLLPAVPDDGPRVIHVDDPGQGLGAAVRAGLDAAPDAPTAVLLGDLPALRPADLDAALADASGHERAFVPDADGTGTTLLTGRSPEHLRPRFGQGSAAAHLEAGHVPLGARSSLRRDVDTAADLDDAAALGVGPRTSAFLAARVS
ncbi:2-phospho-L-lactate guanylyltransferase [Luteimicrobium sp. NPDC057192]|uniref:2-phospho-L-lactate guanylyltransferase n=1 Tax=Luteimicrobium sp. NPDC057192 TaxID=3346042 RepID=UPI0036392994